MFDELFEMFERDREPARPGQKRGVRGFFSRLFGGQSDQSHSDQERDDNRRRYDDDDDGGQYRFNDEDDRRESRSRRSREREPFEFGDD